jgi:hypothetical protein
VFARDEALDRGSSSQAGMLFFTRCNQQSSLARREPGKPPMNLQVVQLLAGCRSQPGVPGSRMSFAGRFGVEHCAISRREQACRHRNRAHPANHGRSSRQQSRGRCRKRNQERPRSQGRCPTSLGANRQSPCNPTNLAACRTNEIPRAASSCLARRGGSETPAARTEGESALSRLAGG